MEEERISTYEKHTIDFRYQKRKHNSHRYWSPQQLAALATTPNRLIPIRLDLEYDGIKLRDQFTWNLYGILY
jgi:hypothetical protein